VNSEMFSFYGDIWSSVTDTLWYTVKRKININVTSHYHRDFMAVTEG